jgi:MFS family permease
MNKNLKILSLAFFFIFFGFDGVQQYVTTFFSDAGKAQTGFILLVLVYLFFTLGNPVAAYCVSKFGLKKCIAIGPFFYFLFVISLQAGSSLAVYLAAGLVGIGASFLWTGTNCYLIKASDKSSYGRDSGYFFTSFAIGSTMGITIMGFLIDRFGFHLPFLVYSVFPLIGLALILTLEDFKSEPQANRLKALFRIMTNKMALAVSSVCFAVALVLGIQFGILPLEIKSIVGTRYMGILLAIFFAFPILASYFLGKLSDRLGRKKIIVVSYAVAIAGLLVLFFAESLVAAAVGMVLIALFYAIMQPTLYVLVGDVSSPENIEFLAALFWTMQMVGTLFALVISTIWPTRLVYFGVIAAMLLSLLFLGQFFKLSLAEIKIKIAQNIKK